MRRRLTIHGIPRTGRTGGLAARAMLGCALALLAWCGRDLNWARLAADLVIAIAPGSWRVLRPLAPHAVARGVETPADST